MSIKYYHLAKDEELPEEFCAIRDVGGEPREYVFYVPDAENVRLRELLQRTWDAFHDATAREFVTVKNELRELGVKVDDGQQRDV